MNCAHPFLGDVKPPASGTLFPLPPVQTEWFVESFVKTQIGEFWRTWNLLWGQGPAEVAKTYTAQITALHETLMQTAIRKGDIEDENDWDPPSTLQSDTSFMPVATIQDVAAEDPGHAAMLRTREGFALEFAAEGPFMVGGTVEPLS